MRMFAQDRAFYREIRVDGTEHPEALRRLELLEQVALAPGKSMALGSAAFHVSAAVWWAKRIKAERRAPTVWMH